MKIIKKTLIDTKALFDDLTYSDLIGVVMAMTEDTEQQDIILSYCNDEMDLNNALELLNRI